LEQPVDGRQIGWVLVGSGAPDPVPGGLAGNRSRCLGQGIRVGRIQVGGESAQEIGTVTQQLTLANENGYDIATSDLAEERQHFVSYSVAQESGVAVRGIVDDLNLQGAAQLLGVGTAQPEKGTALRWSHATEAVPGATAQERHDDGLRLVVGGVTHENALGQNRVSRRSGPGLEVRAGGDLSGLGAKPGAEASGYSFDHFGFDVRSIAQAVVDVHGRDLEPTGDSEN
jgi:hypothetical protein